MAIAGYGSGRIAGPRPNIIIARVTAPRSGRESPPRHLPHGLILAHPEETVTPDRGQLADIVGRGFLNGPFDAEVGGIVGIHPVKLGIVIAERSAIGRVRGTLNVIPAG